MPTPAIAVHGGAGRWERDPETLGRVQQVLREAVETGLRVLNSGSALDAVVEAVKVMEDSGVLNAGVGSTVDLSGSVSMDAGVMYSRTGRAGAVAYVKYPRNPVVLARYVMELTDHVLLVGDAADLLASRLGLERHPGPLERVRRMYGEAVQRIARGEVPQRFYSRSISLWLSKFPTGTVGAVAVDREGELAAATSTGGVFLKMPGRVGDSPIVGAGFYANRCAAASATGIGEFIILYHLSLRAVEAVCNALDVAEAAERVMADFTSRFGRDTAGFIVIDRLGRAYGAYNTQAMPWAYGAGGRIELRGL
ncbi:MAG: isoaspartyl peptidase/L-asparaginase [Desulfurococcaceae archaeon]|nr:isoaspartyl peptidase/L-asparaginase [Desulfurococcaceae archaeon]